MTGHDRLLAELGGEVVAVAFNYYACGEPDDGAWPLELDDGGGDDDGWDSDDDWD